MPPTRATRLQRKAAGSEASPFQSLDSAPPRARATRQKAPGKENEKVQIKKKAEPRSKDANKAPSKVAEKSHGKDTERSHNSETGKPQAKKNAEKETRSAGSKVPVTAARISSDKPNETETVVVEVQVTENRSSMLPDTSLYATSASSSTPPIPPTAPIPTTTPIPPTSPVPAISPAPATSPSSPASPSPNLIQDPLDPPSASLPSLQPRPKSDVGSIYHDPLFLDTHPVEEERIAPDTGYSRVDIMFWDAEPRCRAVRHILNVPRLELLEFLILNRQKCRSYGTDHPVLSSNISPEALRTQVANQQMAKAKPRVSRLKRALDRKKAEDQKREDEARDAAERARDKAAAARARATAARSTASARARNGDFDSTLLVRGSRSPSPQQTPHQSPQANSQPTTHVESAGSNQNLSNFQDDNTGVLPILPQTPTRNWGLSSVVSHTVGRLNPFSYFGRQTPDPRAQTAPTTPVIQSQVHVESAAVLPNDATASDNTVPPSQDAATSSTKEIISAQANSMEDVQSHATGGVENNQQALVLSSSDDSEQKLLEYIAKTHPSLANAKTVENLKTTLRQYEMLEKHRERQDNSTPKKRSQTTPDASPIAGAKRKRKSRPSPEVIPNPPGCSYGMDLAYFSDSSSENGSDAEQSEDSLADITPPSKKQRVTPPKPVSNPLGMSRELQRRLEARAERRKRLLLGHPNKPEPYLGNIFAEPKQNIFQDWEHFPATFTPMSPTTSGQFTVPESSSDEEDNIEPALAPKMNPQTKSGKRVCFSSEDDSSDAEPRANMASGQGTPRSILKGSTSYNKASQSQNPVQDTEQGQPKGQNSAQAQAPPPAPTPSHATLPAVQPSNAANGATGDALAIARAQANKYAPKVSSNLRESHRLSSSPLLQNGTTPAGKSLFSQQTPLVNGFTSDSDEAQFYAGSFKTDSHTKLVTADAFAGLEFDPVVAEALAALGDGIIPDTLTDLDISEEVLKILDYAC